MVYVFVTGLRKGLFVNGSRSCDDIKSHAL